MYLYGILAIFLATPAAYWSTTISPGLPLEVYLYDIGRLLALEGFILILFQFVLSSKVKWIERGIGLDSLYRVHRRFGQLGLVLVAIHPALLYGSLFAQGYELSGAMRALGLVDLPPGGAAGPVELVWGYRLALNSYIILFGFAIVVLAAVLYGRLQSLSYEAWRTVHYAVYLLFPMAFFHALVLGSDLQSSPLWYFWVGLAALYGGVFAHRIWKRLDLRKHPYRVASVDRITHDTWNLGFDGGKVDRKPGQFMLLQLVREGKTSESHPFTISSGPEEPPSVTVKSVGDFTSMIGETKVSDVAFLDAPYGVFSFINHDSKDLVFIAGGIGITPFLSMLRHIRDAGLERNVTLIWGNKTQEDIAFREEIEAMEGQIHSLKVVHVMSEEPTWQGEKGFIDEELLKRCIPDFAGAEFFVCGPPLMMQSVEASLRHLGVPKDSIHTERFALR